VTRRPVVAVVVLRTRPAKSSRRRWDGDSVAPWLLWSETKSGGCHRGERPAQVRVDPPSRRLHLASPRVGLPREYAADPQVARSDLLEDRPAKTTRPRVARRRNAEPKLIGTSPERGQPRWRGPHPIRTYRPENRFEAAGSSVPQWVRITWTCGSSVAFVTTPSEPVTRMVRRGSAVRVC
jgi:hypothetical protein